MSNFEKITASPEALGAFLSSFSTVNGPWDAEFHKKFCAACDREDCDGKPCPHQGKRNNPEWWLRLGAKQGETDGLVIRIKAAFPIEWDKEYYTVAEIKKSSARRVPAVTIPGK